MSNNKKATRYVSHRPKKINFLLDDRQCLQTPIITKLLCTYYYLLCTYTYVNFLLKYQSYM